MKKPCFLIGTLIVFTVTAVTASGWQSYPLVEAGIEDAGNTEIIGQKGISVSPLSTNPALSDGTASEILSDPGPNLTAQGQQAGYIFDPMTNWLTINVRVMNNGTSTAGHSILGFYLSTDITITRSDRSIGEENVSALFPASYSDIVHSVVISPFEGTRYVGAIVDDTGMIAEDDETDNVRYIPPPLSIPPPNAPILEYPPNNATGIPINPTLSWQCGGGAQVVLYWVEVFDDLGACIYSNSTHLLQQEVGPLSNGAIYSWKVYAENIGGDSPYSTEWYFTTETGSDVLEDHGEIPRVFALKPPYPNPFNAETKIAFDLPESCIVRLKIHDMLGREVETLIEEPMVAGAHEVVWHAEGLTSGIYLCRLEAGGFADTKKLVLQR